MILLHSYIPPSSSCFFSFFSSSNPSITISSPLTQHLIVSCFSLMQSQHPDFKLYFYSSKRKQPEMSALCISFHNKILFKDLNKEYFVKYSLFLCWQNVDFVVVPCKDYLCQELFLSLLKYNWLKLNLWDVISQFPIVWIFKSHFMNLNTWQ